MRRALTTILPPLLVLVLAAVGTEWLLTAMNVQPFLVPKPSAIWHGVIDHRGELETLLWVTSEAALIGFAVAALGGVLIAIVLSSSRWIERAFYPYAVFFQTVPIVAIAPLFVIWIGTGLKSVATCAGIVAIFPVIANTLAGLLSTDPALRDLFRLYGAGRLATLFKLKLPAALPNIITGLRIATGLAVIGTIVGEFMAGDYDRPGLGFQMVAWLKQGDTALTFAAVLVSSLLGLLLLCTVNLIGWFALRRWHASEQN